MWDWALDFFHIAWGGFLPIGKTTKDKVLSQYLLCR